jgi:hypothetical protein
MKQGTGNSSMSGRKVEPVAHKVSRGAVSQIGMAMGNHATGSTKVMDGNTVSKPLYAGKGFEAPKDMGRTVHHGGSQGKR